MKEFLLIFRQDAAPEKQPTQEQLQSVSKPWQDWMGSIAAQNKLANRGGRLGNEGNVIKPGKVVTNGPYVEMKETIGGYIIVKAASLEEATELSKSCPMLASGGSVEVRSMIKMD